VIQNSFHDRSLNALYTFQVSTKLNESQLFKNIHVLRRNAACYRPSQYAEAINQCLHLPYNANARTSPPTIASPPLANWATAAPVATALPLEDGAPVVGVVDVDMRVDVKVFEIVRFELGYGVEMLELSALVDVEITVTVEEGTEVVLVAV